MKNISISIFLIILFLSSCVSQKELTYLQKNGTSKIDSLGFYSQFKDSYKIQTNDILNLSFKSFDQKSTEIFNSNISRNSNVQVSDAIVYINGNSVDDFGFIELPVLGKIQVEGLTLEETKVKIEQELLKYFKKDALYLKVQLAGIRFSILGEVNRPGKYVIYQNQASIFEAIAMAGDITMVGIRHDVQLIRQTPQGVKVFNLNLNDDNIINSPYYFIQPNDLINVKPLKVKSWGVGTVGFRTLLDVLTLVSTTLLIIISVDKL